MNPDSFMPFFGNEFFRAVKGHGKVIGFMYLEALWYYWSHNHCAGLKDDHEFLRRICDCETMEWSETKAVIFDNDQFFTMGEDGTWHQKRAFELWQEKKAKYDSVVKRGQLGAKRRWGK